MIDSNKIEPGSVNVFIGPNGSGKSRLLRKLCASFLKNGEDVIAIAPTIYDRFERMPQGRLKYFGARQGRNGATKVIRSALVRAVENPQVLKNLTRALEYTNFDPVIGIGLSTLNLDNFSLLSEKLSTNELEELHSTLLKWQSSADQDGIVHLALNSFSFSELDALSFAILARHDDSLHRFRATSRIRYYLYRKGMRIPLLEACSGELAFITTVAFISAQIERGSVIAIDEPDTSLHPTWQQSYVRTLLDLFYRYEPRILISTHSPIIISGAQVADETLTVHEIADGQTREFDHTQLSLEEMYDRLFGLITPKNHYLSQRAVSLLNALNDGSRSKDEVMDDLAELRLKSYDKSQREVIAKFEDLAHKLGDPKYGSST